MMCNHHDNISFNSRRRFLQQIAGVGTGILAITVSGCASRSPVASLAINEVITPNNTTSDLQSVGCSLRADDAEILMSQLSQIANSGPAQLSALQSSGNQQLDQALGIMLAHMAATFEVQPGFAFYDDGNSKNAVAMRKSYLPNTDGTVLLGRNLLQSELERSNNGDMPIMAICAHEFGHIVQYTYDLQPRLQRGQDTRKRVELHADLLAGYFIGRNINRLGSMQLLEIGRAWEELGDSDFTDYDHHGSREERLRAVEAGFKRAQLSLSEAIEAGARILGA